MSNNNKFKLAICKRFNAELYGKDENSSPDIENHYLIIYTIELDEFYNNEYINLLQNGQLDIIKWAGTSWLY